MKRMKLIVLLSLLLVGATTNTASAGKHGCRACGRCRTGYTGPFERMQADFEAGRYQSWHGNYYDPAWGTPVALVVPPTAGVQTDYRWGVPASRLSRIYPQFQRSYPGPMGGAGPFSPTPHWPSDTNQFGVSYVRGPW